ncbi:hypothetical protein Vqi01_37620 [Micromonospora qiuiae]|uniref:Tn3 transposase DDE domain-containing protein n=1 Tax=Micromonospora qiuiae TaxID=502268 RepID=A0ABQ4JEM6_9ACTN|nr:hypothetical protein [Micromonospora qiuiae]GIJ28600.1 hypothetical protein Vqi01_37620 [Micromonospora qiuiae]
MTVTLTLTEQPKLNEAERMKFAGLGNVALYGSKTEFGFTRGHPRRDQLRHQRRQDADGLIPSECSDAGITTA